MTASPDALQDAAGAAAFAVDWSDTSPWVRFGGRMSALLLLSGALFGVIAAGGEPAAVRQGQVIADEPAGIARATVDGAIAALLVRSGDYVKAGQILMELEDVNARAERAGLDVRLLDYRIQEARLVAEIEMRDNFETPKSINPAEPEAARVIAEQTNLMSTRRDARADGRNRLEARIAELEAIVAGDELRLSELIQERDLNEREMSAIGPLFDRGGGANPQRVGDLQRRSVRIGADIAAAKKSRAQAKADLAEIASQRAAADGRFQDLARDELHRLRSKIKVDEEALRSLSRRQSTAAAVTAPASGFVEVLSAAIVGNTVADGEPLAEVRAADAGFVVAAPVETETTAPGEVAAIMLRARGDSAPARFVGRVRSVAPRPGATGGLTALIDVPRDEAAKHNGAGQIAPATAVDVTFRDARAKPLLARLAPWARRN
jgi:multidrug resistance efflux pump